MSAFTFMFFLGGAGGKVDNHQLVTSFVGGDLFVLLPKCSCGQKVPDR